MNVDDEADQDSGHSHRHRMIRDPILCARDGAIVTVTLNNPDKLNALSKAMWSMLGETMRALDADASA